MLSCAIGIGYGATTSRHMLVPLTDARHGEDISYAVGTEDYSLTITNSHPSGNCIYKDLSKSKNVTSYGL